MNNESQKIISNPEFIKQILTLKTKQEVKDAVLKSGAILTDEEFDTYTNLIVKSLERIKEGGTLSDEDLEAIAGGGKAFINKAVSYTGMVIAFPFRTVSYGVGAIVASIPRGIVDGAYDAWTGWKEYDN